MIEELKYFAQISLLEWNVIENHHLLNHRLSLVREKKTVLVT